MSRPATVVAAMMGPSSTAMDQLGVRAAVETVVGAPLADAPDDAGVLGGHGAR